MRHRDFAMGVSHVVDSKILTCAQFFVFFFLGDAGLFEALVEELLGVEFFLVGS